MNAKDGNVRMSTKAEWFARLMEDPEDAMKSEKIWCFEGLPPEVEWEEFPDGAIGYYRPEYAAEWKRHICMDGTWEGWFETKCTSELSKQV